MSEPIAISIEIGGELPESLLKKFLSTAMDQIEEVVEGPTDLLNLQASNGNVLKWVGLANYGDVSDLQAFCRQHNLSYLYHCEGKYEYSAEVSFWVPGMKTQLTIPSDQSGRWLAEINTVRPLAELLLGLAKDGAKILPAFLTRPGLEEVVEKGLKNPKNLIPDLEDLIRRLLPEEPTIPKFTIKKG